jgi:hypothetical protein
MFLFWDRNWYVQVFLGQKIKERRAQISLVRGFFLAGLGKARNRDSLDYSFCLQDYYFRSMVQFQRTDRKGKKQGKKKRKEFNVRLMTRSKEKIGSLTGNEKIKIGKFGLDFFFFFCGA